MVHKHNKSTAINMHVALYYAVKYITMYIITHKFNK